MEKRSDRFEASVKALAASERRQLDGHPTPEELASYHAGELRGEEAERLQDHLALCPECARLVLDLSRFEDGELDAGSGGLTDDELVKDLEVLRERLREEGRSTARVLTFEPHPGPTERRVDRVVPGWYHAVAAALAAAVLSLGWWTLELERSVERWRQPQLMIDAADLAPERDGGTRGARDAVEVRVAGSHFLLRLGLAEVRSFASYRVTIRDAGDRLIWRAEVPRLSEFGDLRLVVPRDFLPPGPYEIRLLGDEDELAVYAVRIAIEK